MKRRSALGLALFLLQLLDRRSLHSNSLVETLQN